MKDLFKPITSMFGKKTEEHSPQKQDASSSLEQNPVVQMDHHGLAKRYCDTFSAIQTVQTKLDKLLETKEHIAEERFASLHEQYRTFLDKHTPGLKKLSDEISRRIDSYIEEKKDAADRFTEIRNRIQQEAKLLEAGAISKEEYIEKIQSFKPEEKEYKGKYKTSQDRINILKDAKNNIYTPPPEPPNAAKENDDGKGDKRSSEDSPDKVTADKITGDSNKKQSTSNDVYSGKDVDINIECGANLSVKIEGIAIPVTANFVGTQKHEYIIITHPAPYTTIKPKLFPGNKLLVECLFDGKLSIFSSAIIENLTKPIRAVVLEYPDKVTIKTLRSSSRTICRLPSTLNFRGSGKEAIISDMNPNGCRIEVMYMPAERNYIAKSDDNVKIDCSFPGDAEVYTISGTIKNIRKKELALSYGIQFTEISESSRQAIIKYLSTLQS